MIIQPDVYKLSRAGRLKLETCDERLRSVVRKMLTRMDISVVSGHRNEDEQSSYFNRGLSKRPWPLSAHNTLPSRAVDIAPYHNRILPVDWEDVERICYMAGIFMEICASVGLPILWGGDWDQDMHIKDETFRDYCHFELIGG